MQLSKKLQNKINNEKQIYYKDNQSKTLYYQEKYGFKLNSNPKYPTWNAEADAFKHAFMQADLSLKYGDATSWMVGMYHEYEGYKIKQPQHEQNMDLWNNKIGRNIAREIRREQSKNMNFITEQQRDDMIAEKIMQKMRNGELITSPDDPRARTLIEKFENNSKTPKNWQEYLNTPKDFSKLDELKTPTVEGVGNNAALVDNSELLVKYPAPTINTSNNWLSTLGQIFSTTASLLGLVGGVVGGLKPSVGGSLGGSINGVEYPSIKFPIKQHHTGGKISGRDEVLAILRGGETVRTETQENELQQEKFKELMKEFAPVISGEEDEANPYQQLLGGQKNKKDPKLPVLLEKTRQDEELIISIIADAWKCNRLGFRNILRYE